MINNLFFASDFKKDTLNAIKNESTNITQLNLKFIQIPLPPLEIQNKIATHIQNLKNEIQALKQQAEQNQKNALTQFETEVFNAF